MQIVKKFTCSNFMSSNKYLKIHQLNIIKIKERLQIKLVKDIKVFLKKKKEKGDNTVVTI